MQTVPLPFAVAKGRLAGQQVIQGTAEAVEVGTDVDVMARGWMV
jgi:hypothetical protein